MVIYETAGYDRFYDFRHFLYVEDGPELNLRVATIVIVKSEVT